MPAAILDLFTCLLSPSIRLVNFKRTHVPATLITKPASAAHVARAARQWATQRIRVKVERSTSQQPARLHTVRDRQQTKRCIYKANCKMPTRYAPASYVPCKRVFGICGLGIKI